MCLEIALCPKTGCAQDCTWMHDCKFVRGRVIVAGPPCPLSPLSGRLCPLPYQTRTLPHLLKIRVVCGRTAFSMLPSRTCKCMSSGAVISSVVMVWPENRKIQSYIACIASIVHACAHAHMLSYSSPSPDHPPPARVAHRVQGLGQSRPCALSR
jgi:hypothetical protein